ncbi:PREDICTED: nucleoporin Nup43 [Dufourea novaeangliae]|uniref:Nucleoporin Nup43 n=1 Tax=Dufourea novaeangliae TaxID=178035 RepID=A0A154PH77_DUFNO|nr:PREDICTED: nucleoporin Nup43 [Dufourea novaeangliae]KZC10530.1 Nucleoporin Nup43 [Dufourea novaeangliae]
MSENVQGTFVSEKIFKIRWKHEDFEEASNFLTGSWDDPVNKVTHWTFQVNDVGESYPAVVSSYPVLGDVTEIKFISRDFFVVSTSTGTVRLLQIQENPYSQFKEHVSWELIHKFNKTSDYASCTAMSTFEQDVVSVGEDGRINLLTAAQKKPVRVIDEADSCSIYCVDFLRHNEILTGNLRGHMKVWDLRSNQDLPATTFMLSDQAKTEATSIAHHPTQRHIVVAGGGDGSLTVWDLRHNTYPMTQLNAHAKAVSEILFHPDRPENLFTCSHSGELWHWNNSQQSKLSLDPTNTHWLNSIGTNGKVNVMSLCSAMHKPINSIDINRSTLLFGCDNEAMYIIKNIAL